MDLEITDRSGSFTDYLIGIWFFRRMPLRFWGYEHSRVVLIQFFVSCQINSKKDHKRFSAEKTFPIFLFFEKKIFMLINNKNANKTLFANAFSRSIILNMLRIFKTHTRKARTFKIVHTQSHSLQNKLIFKFYFNFTMSSFKNYMKNMKMHYITN